MLKQQPSSSVFTSNAMMGTNEIFKERMLFRSSPKIRSFVVILLAGIALIVFLSYSFTREEFDVRSRFQIINQISIQNESTQVAGEVDDDFNQLIDFKSFKYIHTHRSCSELAKQPKVILAVHSAPTHFEHRVLIRETWGYKDPRALLIFLIAMVEDQSVQAKIDVEFDLYGDIVQGNFLDSYKNLTYKHVMVMKWFTYNCPDVPYLLKVDDDVFVNTPLLYEYIEVPSNESQEIHKEKLIFCGVSHTPPVIREIGNKWYVSPEEYPEDNYPTHCSGYTVLLSSDVAQQIYHKAQTLPYFWVDDVFVTGIVPAKLNITHTPFYKHVLGQKEILEDKGVPFLFTGFNIHHSRYKELWKTVGGKVEKISIDHLR